MKGTKKLLVGIVFAVLSMQVFATPKIQPGSKGFKPPLVTESSGTGTYNSSTDPQRAPNNQNLVVRQAFEFPEPGVFVLMVVGLLSTVIGLLGAGSFLRRFIA